MLNHLKQESSPYLKQYANNAINWYPWGEEALNKAKIENKPIFLSIGHSACSKCEVMKNESFQDEKIALLLNERFISIKIDKEEHPEIDKYYQKVYKLMNRSIAGSPLSIFMTENLEPFYSAGYISPEAQEAEFGFEELLRTISKKYITEHETFVEKGKEVLQYINPKKQSIEATKLDINILNTIVIHTEALLDKENGGFGGSKFPNVSILNLLLKSYEYSNEKALLDATLLTLDKMKEGEIYDPIHGGFYHYATDKTWANPYRVKTTYDNALLSQLYIQAYNITGNNSYKEVAFQTIDFMLKEMNEEHLFFAKEDSRREKVKIDKSIITSWNAMMISALFKASTLDKKYLLLAKNALERLLKTVYKNQLVYRNSNLNVEGFLEDYAYLGELLVIAYEVNKEENYLHMATDITNRIIEQFYAYGEWNFSNGKVKIKTDTHDSDYPSALSTTLSLLMSISSLVDDTYKKFVFNTLELNSYNLMRQPLSSPKLTQTLLNYLKK